MKAIIIICWALAVILFGISSYALGKTDGMKAANKEYKKSLERIKSNYDAISEAIKEQLNDHKGNIGEL